MVDHTPSMRANTVAVASDMNTPLSQRVHAIVARAITQRVFPGAVVLVASDTAVLHHAAYGTTMYSAPGSKPVELTTIYDIASLTKMFTATAALHLSDHGALDLHAPVVKYLPDVQAYNVTIWHLLTHTSGLDIRLSALRYTGREGLLDAVYRMQPPGAPGTMVAYSNVNSLLLGEIVARICDAPLDVVLNRLVIAPLGLRDTSFCPDSALLPRIAPTEIDNSWRGSLVHGSVHDESTHALGGVAGHAGLFSSADDLLLFCQMWLAQWLNIAERLTMEPLLRHETVRLACTNHTPNLNAACGLGWMLDRPNFMGPAPTGTFGHTGFTGPAICIVPHARRIIVILSNRVYPHRGNSEHHAVTAALLGAVLEDVDDPTSSW